MSYCRFSSTNWKSDVYVYEDCGGGWTTHVAGRRRAFAPVPDIRTPRWTMRVIGEWDQATRTFIYKNRFRKLLAQIVFGFLAYWHRFHMWTVGLIPLRDIDLPFAGETFNDATPGECAERLLHLRSVGYTVPQYAIDALMEESKESAP